MSRTIVVSDAFFAEMQTIAGTPIYVPATPSLPAAPAAPATLQLPPELAGRTRMELSLPWGAPAGSNRIVSPRQLDSTNVFIGRFKTGATIPSQVRLQAAEFPGPSVQRNAVLMRVADGAVLEHYAGTTVTGLMTNTVIAPSFINPHPPVMIVPNTEYAFVVWNAPGVQPSTMLMELYS
jgi:hypothetical protein